MLNIGIPEIAIILVVVILFFFGKDKLIEWAKAIGEAKGPKEKKNQSLLKQSVNKMIGAPELVIIAIAAGVFFFGKNQIFDWAKTVGEAKKAFNDGLDEQKKIADEVSTEAGLKPKKKSVSKKKSKI